MPSSYIGPNFTTIKGSGKNNNHGTILNGGSVVGTKFAAQTLAASMVQRFNVNARVYASANNGASYILNAAGGSITSAITQSGTTGFVNVNINSHGLSLGSIIIVAGTDIQRYNQIHVVTVVTDSNNVQTDVYFTSAASTAGTYKTVTGNFGTMTKNQYVGTIICSQVAGQANTILRSPSAEYFRVAYNPARGSQRYGITSWDYVTGKPTFNANRGANLYYHDIAGNNDNLQQEPFPTKAIPGHLVYFYSAQDAATISFYKPRQE